MEPGNRLRQGVARLNWNGTLDAGFVPAGFTFSTFVRGLVLQPGEKVVIAGRLKLNTNGIYYPLLRLNGDGSLDNSFTLVPSSSLNCSRPPPRPSTTRSTGAPSRALCAAAGVSSSTWRRC